MSETIAAACPKCRKVMKVPANLAGKATSAFGQRALHDIVDVGRARRRRRDAA